MCGRLNVADSLGVKSLCDQLEITLWPEEGMLKKRFTRATERVSIVMQHNGKSVMRNAVWWLLLEPDHRGPVMRFIPSKYTSFNTRYDKLNKRGSAGYQAFRQQRCVIPASGFGESQKRGALMTYHDMIASEDTPLAMGGLYREWHGRDPHGNTFIETSCSVVTLAPHPKLMPIHDKASPLMLSLEDNSLQRWLDCEANPVETLSDLLEPTIRHQFTVTPINKPSLYQPIGESFTIEPD
jgi:putative SOS response-associated peptidase YedK